MYSLKLFLSIAVFYMYINTSMMLNIGFNLKIKHTGRLGGHQNTLARVEMDSDWLTRISRSILAKQNFLQNRDMACKL